VLPTAILSVGKGGSSAVLHGFEENGREPSVILKVGLTERTRRARAHEATMLASLSGAASAAGADVPAIVASDPPLDGIVIERGLAGRPLAACLADDPALLPGVLDELAAWLERWHLGSRTAAAPEGAIERVLASVRSVVPDLDAAATAYLRRLEALCARQSRETITLVAAHNDLTMVNVLRGKSGRLGVVDWEVAGEQALPLMDFFYAAADAIAATSRYADRVLAFEAAFRSDAEIGRRVGALGTRLSGALDLPPDLAELCFHACWLMHAANEKKSPNASGRRPFLGIVQRLAAESAAGETIP
jgi:hypothetical protein